MFLTNYELGMRNVFLYILISAILMGCAERENSPGKDKYFIPSTPKATSDLLTPELLWSFGRVGVPKVSPDGQSVLYGVTYISIPENKSYRDLYVVPVKGDTAKRITFTDQSLSDETWRPDGKKIGYLFSKDGESQLWEMNPDGSSNHQVSRIEGGILGYKYAPDLKHIIYIKAVKLDNSIHDLFPDLPKANARLETDLMYRHWDKWHDYTYQHIFIADYSDNGLTNDKDIMAGEKFDSPMKPDFGMEQIEWNPDSKSLAYTCKKLTGRAYTLSTNSDIYIYDLQTGKTVDFTEGMMGYDMNPTYSPDGKYLAWESMARDGYESDKNRLFIADLSTGLKKDYTASFDQDVHNLAWAKTANPFILFLIFMLTMRYTVLIWQMGK